MKVIILLEYENNNKKYVVYLKNNKLSFGYFNNNKICNDLSLDELESITAIYNLLVGDSKDLIKLSSTKINNSLITFFYNPINKLYSFYEVNDNKYQLPDSDTIIKLNMIFNNHSGVLYNNKQNKDEKIYKIVIKKGTKVIVVFTLASLLLSYLPAMPSNEALFNIDYSIDNIYKDPNLVYDNSSYSFEEIKEAIDNNPNLSEEEKTFLYGLKEEIDENKDYIDINKLKTNLSDLAINYNSCDYTDRNKLNVFVDYRITGSYTYMGTNINQIDLYNEFCYHATSFKDANKATLIHEIHHLVNNKSPLLSIPGYEGNIVGTTYSVFDVEANVLNEMVNELFSREYSVNFNEPGDFSGYDHLMPVMYALAEIIDTDTLRRYKYNSDDYYINNYFASIGVSNKYVYTLYKDLNLLQSNVLEDEERIETSQEVYQIIKYMYEMKYNHNMEDDLIMISYLYHTDFSNPKLDEKLDNIVGGEEIFDISHKGYLSSTYKELNDSVVIYKFNDDGEDVYKEIYRIDDSNRFISNRVK